MNSRRRFNIRLYASVAGAGACVLLVCAAVSVAKDWPSWGGGPSRNMVSPETASLPAEATIPEPGDDDKIDPAKAKNLKWAARLGSQTYGNPTVAGGRVYVGTNNDSPRDPKHKGDRGVLMCFDEATGKFLWQLVSPKREEDPYMDWPKTGLSSPATDDGHGLLKP